MILKSKLKSIRGFTIVLLVPIFIYILLYLGAPDIVSIAVLLNCILQTIPACILAWGLYITLGIGNRDFMSVGAVVITSAIIGGNIAVSMSFGILGVGLICILVGGMLGFTQGLLYKLLKVPTMVISLGMLLVLESVNGLINGGSGASIPNEWAVMGKFPYNMIVFIIFFALTFYLYNFHRIGYLVRAIGGNYQVSKMNGLRVTSAKIQCLVIGGCYAGCYAFLALGSSGVMRNSTNFGSISIGFNAIMSVMLSLTLAKLTNLVIAIIIGSFTMQLVKVLFTIYNLNSQFQSIAIGIIVLIFMAVSSSKDTVLRKKLHVAFRGIGLIFKKQGKQDA